MPVIGLVGEAPNDTESIRNLLGRKYGGSVSFITFLNNINGSMLDSQRTKRYLRIEYESENTDIVIFIRDLDGVESESEKIKLRNEYFTQFNRVVDKTGVFLLAIYELETVLLYDLELFNRVYKSDAEIQSNPMEIIDPKEYLKEISVEPKYDDSHNPDLFSKIDITSIAKCKFLDRFYGNFDLKLKSLSRK